MHNQKFYHNAGGALAVKPGDDVSTRLYRFIAKHDSFAQNIAC